MVDRKIAALIAGAALLVAAAPRPTPLPPIRANGSPSRQSPVRCRIGVPEVAGYVTSRGSRPIAPPPSVTPPSIVSVPSPVITPAAPAAPPPPPMYPGGPRSVVSSAVSPRAPAAYGTPANRERYEGRAVASINDTATAPVSTFSVDVDTGSYANVRRFLTHGEVPPQSAVRTEEMINYFRYDYPRPTSRLQPFSVTTDVAKHAAAADWPTQLRSDER
jgi:Ca-activated chloride channel family protein